MDRVSLVRENTHLARFSGVEDKGLLTVSSNVF